MSKLMQEMLIKFGNINQMNAKHLSDTFIMPYFKKCKAHGCKENEMHIGSKECSYCKHVSCDDCCLVYGWRSFETCSKCNLIFCSECFLREIKTDYIFCYGCADKE